MFGIGVTGRFAEQGYSQPCWHQACTLQCARVGALLPSELAASVTAAAQGSAPWR